MALVADRSVLAWYGIVCHLHWSGISILSVYAIAPRDGLKYNVYVLSFYAILPISLESIGINRSLNYMSKS